MEYLDFGVTKEKVPLYFIFFFQILRTDEPLKFYFLNAIIIIKNLFKIKREIEVPEN